MLRSRAGGLRAGRGEEGVRVLRLSPGECLLKVSTKYRGNFHNQQFLEANIPIKAPRYVNGIPFPLGKTTVEPLKIQIPVLGIPNLIKNTIQDY